MDAGSGCYHRGSTGIRSQRVYAITNTRTYCNHGAFFYACLLLISIFISNFTGVARWKRDRRRANCSINVLLREVFPSNMGKNANISVTAVETGHWFQEDTYRYHKTYSAYD